MKETLERTVIDTLDYLMTIVQEGRQPEEAESGLRPLRKRHSDVAMHLIWEEESYDRSIHYDALLNLPESGTVSISYCDDRAKPWPLRGVHRWSDADLVRVNNNVMTVDQAIACIDFIWEEASITDRLVNVCLIQEELARNPIDISDEELQVAMDGFRRARKLYKADETLRWMERRGVTYPELERLVESQVTVAKLRDRVAAGRVQGYFDAHSADFDTAYIARFALPSEAIALEVADRIRRGVAGFYEAAQGHFIAEKASVQSKEFFTSLQRRETPAEIRESLFRSAPGSVLGPVCDGDHYALIRVLSVVRATLDDPTRESIKKVLFDDWLQECRQTATIEWLWGNANNTRTAG
jgi:putative peptide maturation system protein